MLPSEGPGDPPQFFKQLETLAAGTNLANSQYWGCYRNLSTTQRLKGPFLLTLFKYEVFLLENNVLSRRRKCDLSVYTLKGFCICYTDSQFNLYSIHLTWPFLQNKRSQHFEFLTSKTLQVHKHPLQVYTTGKKYWRWPTAQGLEGISIL